MSEKRRNKGGRNPKLDPAVFRYTVRFNEEEHNRFLSMFEKSGVYAKSVFIKAHFFGQPFKVLKVTRRWWTTTPSCPIFMRSSALSARTTTKS